MNTTKFWYISSVLDSSDLSDEQLILLRAKIDQRLAGKLIVQQVVVKPEKTSLYQQGQRTGKEYMVNLFNTEAIEFYSHWFNAGANADILLSLAKASPGDHTNNIIKQTSADLISALDTLDSFIKLKTSKSPNEFVIELEGLGPYIAQMRDIHSKVKYFFTLGGHDIGLNWLREALKENYFSIREAMNVSSINIRGAKSKDNDYLTKRTKELVEKKSYQAAAIQIRHELESELAEKGELDKEKTTALRDIKKSEEGKEGEMLRKRITRSEQRGIKFKIPRTE